jgi:Protein of unknown function (DUF2917)
MPHNQSIVPASPTPQGHACCALKPSGAYALPTGRALSLKPAAPSQLRITQGSAWVTLPSMPGDHFLQAGDTLRVAARDALVMEAWQMPQGQTLYFDWDPVPMYVPAPVPAHLAAHTYAAKSVSTITGRSWLRWATPAYPRQSYCAAVLAPLADLRLAVVLGTGAVARLAAGLLGLVVGKLLDAAIFIAVSRARASTV